MSPPSVYWLLTIRVSGFVFVRSGRTSLRRSSFWDSCDTQTPLSIKAATWKTTLPGLVGAFARHLVFYFRMLFLGWNPLFFVVFLVIVSSFAFHCQLLSNQISCSHPSVIILQKTKGKLSLLVCWTMKHVIDSAEAAFCFSWWWSTAWALHQIY